MTKPSYIKFPKRRYICLIFALLLQLVAHAQEETVIDNKGNIIIVRNTVVTTAASAPVDPVENDIWFDTTADRTKIFDGTVWLNIDKTTTLAQTTTTGQITYTNEAGTSQTANVIGAETENNITAGANGGAYYDSPIKAFGKISAGGTVVRASSGVSASIISTGRYRVTLTGLVSDGSYIIQLTQPGRGGSGLIGGDGNDDPGISYANQSASGFDVIIGDNDNGGTDRSRFNSEFMFTVLDL